MGFDLKVEIVQFLSLPLDKKLRSKIGSINIMRSAYLESGVSSVLKHYAFQWEMGYKLVRLIDFNKFLEIGLTPLSRYSYHSRRLISNCNKSLCDTVEAMTTFWSSIISCKNRTVIQIRCRNYDVISILSTRHSITLPFFSVT